jgi:putative effector of murein hydrolase
VAVSIPLAHAYQHALADVFGHSDRVVDSVSLGHSHEHAFADVFGHSDRLDHLIAIEFAIFECLDHAVTIAHAFDIGDPISLRDRFANADCLDHAVIFAHAFDIGLGDPISLRDRFAIGVRFGVVAHELGVEHLHSDGVSSPAPSIVPLTVTYDSDALAPNLSLTVAGAGSSTGTGTLTP